MSGNDSAQAPDPNPTVVRLDPADRRIEPGTETTIDAIVQRIADDGVGVYDLTVTVDGPATIEEATVGGNPNESLTTTEINEAGTEVHANAVSATVDGAGRESILSLSIRGEEDGDGHATVSVDVRTLGTQAGDTYDIQKEIGADVLVRPRGRGRE
ncbi:hypothetical protein [Halalkalicoccus ordinarius]|uniref:hypothetical protein n=1 Tax=Halalkalicoccus ordinarius TaxID=3116651 RepID=UPI00300E80E9